VRPAFWSLPRFLEFPIVALPRTLGKDTLSGDILKNIIKSNTPMVDV
jgi:hypothetical protein